jgi:hypothetical protein
MPLKRRPMRPPLIFSRPRCTAFIVFSIASLGTS